MIRKLLNQPVTTGSLLVILGSCHLLFSFFVNPPGYLTYDSGTYHYMAKTFATTGGFEVWNGFEEHPSPELATAQLRINKGRLVAQYPEFLSILAYPFYVSLGYPGLFVINALAFLGINALIYQLALLLLGRRRIALVSMGVYSLGSFAWEYSQTSYPHLSSTFFVLLAAYLTALSAMARPPRATLLPALGAGLALGVAAGIRLDSFFAAPVVFLPFLLSKPLRPAQAAMATAGLIPPLGLISLINVDKFGSPMPFAYGTTGRAYHADLGVYVAPALLALAVLAAIFVWIRLPGTLKPRALMLGGVAAIVALVLYGPQLAGQAVKLADGAYQIIVDMRIRDLGIQEAALRRSPSGAMIYLDNVKKSLLQSCPYLVILAFTLADVVRRKSNYRRLAFLFIVPAVFTCFFSYLAWHGSIALNMRYLNPILPFTSILAAHAWVARAGHVPGKRAARLGVYSFTILCLLCVLVPRSPERQEAWFLTAPLILALAILVAEGCRRLQWLEPLSRNGVAYLLLFAFAWAGAVTFSNDYPASADHREHHLSESQRLRPLIRDDSLIVSTIPDTCWGLLDQVERLRIANPREDRYRSFQQLVSFHLTAGRPVYLVYPPNDFAEDVPELELAPFDLKVLRLWPGLVALQAIPKEPLAGPAPTKP
ncbi:MAG: hypothetical protein GY719_23555 [bacterium]|nr:hypothetical protein [bacterium]